MSADSLIDVVSEALDRRCEVARLEGWRQALERLDDELLLLPASDGLVELRRRMRAAISEEAVCELAGPDDPDDPRWDPEFYDPDDQRHPPA